MKNILNVITDILTLAAVCIAAVGHVLPWVHYSRLAEWLLERPGAVHWPSDFQNWYSFRSGACLAVVGLLVCLSLGYTWGPVIRRILSLGMLVSSFGALLFQLMVFSGIPMLAGPEPIPVFDLAAGFFLALIPTGLAVFFSFVRLGWTMPPSPSTPLLNEVQNMHNHEAEQPEDEAMGPKLPPIEGQGGFMERRV